MAAPPVAQHCVLQGERGAVVAGVGEAEAAGPAGRGSPGAAEEAGGAELGKGLRGHEAAGWGGRGGMGGQEGPL